MRRSLVASAVLTAALVLGALPGIAGSHSPSPERPLQAVAFQAVRLPASSDGSTLKIRPLDAAGESAGRIDNTARLIESGNAMPPTERPVVDQPAPRPEVLRSAVTAAVSKARVATTSKAKVATTSVSRSTHKSATPKPRIEIPPFKKLLTGLASWYDNGTTAMRLPRGTHVKICGAKTCVLRVVKDWGPAGYLNHRIVDLTPADFVHITGKSLRAGLASVKVYIY